MDINLPMSAPVNNNIQSSLCDRLDAIVFEKIRVANTQLDTRLSIQEKIINKYRQDVEKIHAHQAQRLKREVKKIRKKKPDYVLDDSDINTSRSRNTTETGRQRCLSEPSSLSYCRRYYSHHYNVKDTSREDKKHTDAKKSSDNDFFNMKLRLYYVNMMNNVHQKTHLEHDTPSEYRLSNTDHPDNFDRSRHTPNVTQTSIDEEKDDVFAESHNSFRTVKETYVFDQINEKDQQVLQECKNSGKHQEAGFINAAGLRNGEIKDGVANMSWDRTRDQRRSKCRKAKRKSVIGSGSEEEMEYNEAERRKSKHAFEKIFAGLL
ncbi:uncharacterized protein LOC128548461 [Mercenaria mercenaria]|uniref:uncharacterized protein LOC128548461 n=1 Tax=Mercenaria mercenaria TaxID=6596 RepID=UPI00234FB514|nr:uncharacterized protein LOC128548461 [Mercenaria mercenaria]